jgi:putative methanogenesis marker protein 6
MMSQGKNDTLTKIVVISSDSILPIDAAMRIYQSDTNIEIKETCFGTMVTGPRDAVNRVVREVVDLDRNHIFVKERGFLPGDERRCRSSRGGGPRPGFHYLRHEVQMLPTIGKALDAYDRKAPLKERAQKKKLDVDKLEDMIKSQL